MHRRLWRLRSPSGLLASCSVSQLPGAACHVTVTCDGRLLVQEKFGNLADAAARAVAIRVSLGEWRDDITDE